MISGTVTTLSDFSALRVAGFECFSQGIGMNDEEGIVDDCAWDLLHILNLGGYGNGSWAGLWPRGGTDRIAEQAWRVRDLDEGLSLRYQQIEI
jgi:hypothetical protein